MSAVGYAAFAFVDRPWQAFACAVVAGGGIGAARTANQTLLITVVTPEERPGSFALARVASNLGLGIGATVAGFIVASAQHLPSFQTLYLFDAITYAAFALFVLAMVPNRRAAAAHAGAGGRGFRAVARDRLFMIVIAVNIVLIIVGYALFSNILPPFAVARCWGCSLTTHSSHDFRCHQGRRREQLGATARRALFPIPGTQEARMAVLSSARANGQTG